MIMPLFIILALLAASAKKNTQVNDNYPPAEGSFLDKFYAWLSKKAGGLANGTTAGDRKLKRAPCIVTINGEVMDPPPHTNRDVTYEFFESTGPLIGVDPTCDNFIHMREKDWRKFVDVKTKKGLAYSNNPVIAKYIGLWYWGGWDQDTVTPAEVKAIIDEYPNPQDQLYHLVQLRKFYFVEQGKKSRPKWSQSYIDSVSARADSYNTNFSNFANIV